MTAPVHTTLSTTVDGVPASVKVTIEPPMSSFANVPATVTSGQSFSVTLNMFGLVDTTVFIELERAVRQLPPDRAMTEVASRLTKSATSTASPDSTSCPSA